MTRKNEEKIGVFFAFLNAAIWGMFPVLVSQGVKTIPPLAFALGMYIPLELNTPILAGGIIAHFVAKSTKDETLSNKRRERGTLIASGFIAGGAIMGVLSAFLKFVKFDELGFIHPIITENWAESDGGQLLGLGIFLIICAYMYWDSKRAQSD